LKKILGIEVQGTFGIYDIVCKMDVPNEELLQGIITSKIRKLLHVRHTNTIHCIPEQG